MDPRNWTMQHKALRTHLGFLCPGVLVSTIIAIAAQFLADHYGAPAMLMALLLGIAFHFLSEDGRCVKGIAFTSKSVLRIGVALLGVRISAGLLIDLGIGLIGLIVGAAILTILFGVLGAWVINRGWRFGLLTGGAVAICGASAAMAIAAILPKNEHSDDNLIFTVLSVTVLSTLAMIGYPVLAQFFALDDRLIGVFLGATIHDVAQVVGAGFTVSQEAGDTATLVKLIRVTLLAPVVIVFAFIIQCFSTDEEEQLKDRPPLIPAFVIAFLLLAGLNSIGLVPSKAQTAISDLSRWCLLLAIAAVGMKTSLKTIMKVGSQATILIITETAFIAGFVLCGLLYFKS
ncbi:putative sulfate exporter family transporter (plasmid) [Pseudohalocynthiibacter aestuariivivens]|nr:putative sulfate exporter family transporter [Pseudohalocynthiibacter aestuariivivens]QIE48181.1 putative sulfate exporter family transporter [Pseudohalocynthiibacter aestuariivivens]